RNLSRAHPPPAAAQARSDRPVAGQRPFKPGVGRKHTTGPLLRGELDGAQRFAHHLANLPRHDQTRWSLLMSVAPETLVHPALRVAVIGAGYWGPNLARNFAMSTDWELVAICDMDLDRAEALARKTGNPAVV